MKQASTILLVLSAAFPFVAAHGNLASVTINGQPAPVQAIRQVEGNGPVTSTTNNDLSCGVHAKANVMIAQAMPGNTVEFLWLDGQDHWIHSKGPVLTYMARCENATSCATFDPANANWFKIQEDGLSPGGAWKQQEALFAKQPVSATIPSNLAAGNYMIRHEIIALHSGNAEFYPACVQLSVGGNQKGVPSPKDLVKFPGAYKATDPGIKSVDVYTNLKSYQIPGPKIAKLVDGQVPQNVGSAPPTTGATPPTTGATPPATGAKPTKTGAITPTQTNDIYPPTTTNDTDPPTATDGSGSDPGHSCGQPMNKRARHFGRIMRDGHQRL